MRLRILEGLSCRREENDREVGRLCDLSIYTMKGEQQDKVMEGVNRLIPRKGIMLAETIYRESKEFKGSLGEVNITPRSPYMGLDFISSYLQYPSHFVPMYADCTMKLK